MGDLFSLLIAKENIFSEWLHQTAYSVTSCFIAWSACNADLNGSAATVPELTQGSMCDKPP